MTQSLYHEFGAVTFPTPAAAVQDEQLFSVFDPARDALAALAMAAINAELGPAWNVARVGTQLATVNPVAMTWHDHVYPWLSRQTTLKFPLLSIYRVSATRDEFTIWRQRLVTQWAFEYVLPPLSPDDARRLMGVLDAIEKLIPLVLRRNAAHPAYQSDANQREPLKFSEIRHDRTERGHWQVGQQGEGASYPVMQLVLETTELERGLEGDAADFEGIDVSIGVGDAAEILPQLINFTVET